MLLRHLGQDVPGLPRHGVELHQLQADGRTPSIGSALHMLYVYDVLLALADDLAFTFSEQMDPATTLRVSALRNARSGPCLMTYYIKCLDGTSSGSIPSNSSGSLFGTLPVFLLVLVRFLVRFLVRRAPSAVSLGL